MNRSSLLILNQVELQLRQKGYSENTIQSYTDWIYRFLFFYETEDINSFGEKEIHRFIKFLSKECFMAQSTINQALNALLVLYKEFWKIPVDNYSFKSKHIIQKPLVLSRIEISKILSFLTGEKLIMTSLMYGCGLTAQECLHLRIKNIDFNESIIKIENEKCTRQTLLPKSLKTHLKNQIKKVRTIYNENIVLKNYAGVLLSNFKKFNIKNTTKLFNYHFLFPARVLHSEKESGFLIQNPLSISYLQKAIKKLPKKTFVHKNVCCSSFRHSFATHLIEEGYDVHIIQDLLGHKNLQSTMIYKNLAKCDVTKIVSPLDKLMVN